MASATKNSGLQIELSADGLEASVTLPEFEQSSTLSFDDVIAELAARGVTHGIDQTLLRSICAKPQPGHRYTIARAKLPRAASDEELQLHFSVSHLPKETDHGGVDFRELGTFNSYPAGSVLASKRVSDPGAPGIGLSGKALEQKSGKELRFQLGKGARLSEDGQQVLAAVSGHACLVAERITVIETVDVQGDVDYSVGNIDFVGNVRVSGGIHPGFHVSAQGNVEISGNVEKANISCGGKLTIRGLVFGHGDCQIICKGDAHIGALDQAKVEVGGSLTVDNYIRHCHTKVGDKIELTGRKGNIVGGETSAYRLVVAPIIGSPMATLTKINLGINPFSASEGAHLNHEANDLRGKIEQLSATLTGLQRMRKLEGPAGQRAEESSAKIRQAKLQLEVQLANIMQQSDQIHHGMQECQDARVKAPDRIFPGVLFTFRGHHMFKTTDLIQFVSIAETGGEVKVGPL